jgi:ubiquinol-cytochrome c reductase cytochrome b subunit
MLILIHITILHITGSTNPLGLKRNSDKILFHPFFSSKDLLGVILILLLFMLLCLIFPYILGDPENFNPANPINTPIHIQPE